MPPDSEPQPHEPMIPPEQNPVEEFRMPLWEHLDDLRKAIVRSLIAVTVCSLAAFNFSTELIQFLEKPLLDLLPEGQKHLYFTGIADKFVTYFKVSLIAGVAVSLPVILYQFWKFISPALYPRERKHIFPFLFAGTFAFIVGVAFAFYVIIPTGYKFLIEFGSPDDRAIITLTDYFSMTSKMLLAVGLIFELPVVLILLGRFGIVSADVLAKFRRHAWLVSAFVAAVATPTPDAFSMLIMMIPLCVLYEISIWGIRMTGKPRKSD